MNLSQWTGTGRLGRDAELKYIPSGTAVCEFQLAVSGYKKEGVEATSWIEVELWGKLAESLNQYLVKGKQVAVSGELRIETWEKGGEKHHKTIVKAQSLELLGGGEKKEGPDRIDQQRKDFSEGVGRKHDQKAPAEDFTDDIPF